MYQDNEMQVEVTGGVEVVLSLGCCYSEWQPEDQKYPKPLETTATIPPLVSEEEIMAKNSKIAPHPLLGIWSQIPLRRTLPAGQDHLSGTATCHERRGLLATSCQAKEASSS